MIFQPNYNTNQADSQTYFPIGGMELITKEIAIKYLEHNANNPRKKVNHNRVKGYAADMKAGKWSMNGEAIVFDADGNLKDGQHRLMAVVESGVPVLMFVVRGIDPSIVLFDHNITRRLSQELNCSHNTEVLARFIVSDAYRFAEPPLAIIGSYMENHRNEINKAIQISGTGGKFGIKRNVYSIIYCMIRCGENVSDIERFMRVVNTQFSDKFKESSAAIVFYKYLSQNPIAYKDKKKTFTAMQTFVAAFEDFVNDTPRMRQYKISDTTQVQNLLAKVRKIDGLDI